MREKLFDIGLLVALIVVALMVGVTLYGPSFNFSRNSSNRTIVSNENTDLVAPQTNLNTDAPVVVLNTDNTANDTEVSTASSSDLTTTDTINTSTTSSEVTVIDPNAPNPESSTANSNETVAVVATNTETTVEAATETATTSEIISPSVPLPEGAFALQSIGFSYVTGGAGACGITLESWRHVAVSRDILAKYPCGTEITVNIDKPVAGHTSFKAIVGDTMNSKHSKTVNIYVGTNEPALEYGRQEGSLVP